MSDRDTFSAQVVSGSAAALWDGFDTPAGLDLPGQPSLTRFPVCARCSNVTLLERAPCPHCGWDPFTDHGSPHLKRTCRWISTSVWWQPWTWLRGFWLPQLAQTEIELIRFEMELEHVRYQRALSATAESKAEIARLTVRLRELVEEGIHAGL